MDKQPVEDVQQLRRLRRQLEDEVANRQEHLRLLWIRAYRRLLDTQTITAEQFAAVLDLLDHWEELTVQALSTRLQQIFPGWQPEPPTAESGSFPSSPSSAAGGH